jgi:predicted N-acetyltransferase YhbS
MNITVRQETEKDIDAVYNVVKLAFECAKHTNGDEHNLVNRLRKSQAFIPELSLVAEYNGEIVGHILFTKIKIGEHTSLALAPVAVIPVYQGKSIGSKLILEGHRVARELGYNSVILVGHENYYPRFGYAPASKWKIKVPFDVPDECFMAVELWPNSLENISGVAEHTKEFFEG